MNCDDERTLGSCLRSENNKGINYCRHRQDWKDTALCTSFPWQLATGRWMFHSHSALQCTSINQTCIQSARFLLWAVLRAGLFSCYCIIMEKKPKTMRSLWVGNKLRNCRYTCSPDAIHPARSEERARQRLNETRRLGLRAALPSALAALKCASRAP